VKIRLVWGIRMERILLMVWLEGLVVRLGAKNCFKGSVHIYESASVDASAHPKKRNIGLKLS
jgi:hypothetical protein